jgi:hypothetical protein
VVIDRAGARIVFKAPDLVQEFVPRDHPPRTADKESEKFELESGEDNRAVRPTDLREVEVNAHSTKPHHRMLK